VLRQCHRKLSTGRTYALKHRHYLHHKLSKLSANVPWLAQYIDTNTLVIMAASVECLTAVWLLQLLVRLVYS
jgi:hypothetical protein